MATTGSFIGLKEANRALRALPEFARPEVQQVMDVTGHRVAMNAQNRVRRRTGFLQARIKWQSRPRTLAAVVGVEKAAFYWKFLEYGTVHMEAQPFMRPAAQAEESTHKKAIVEALTRASRTMERAASVSGRLL